MTDPQKALRDMKRVRVVNKYTFPLSILLVVLGLALAQPMGMVRYASVGLLAFSVLFNFLSVQLIRQESGRSLRLTRIYGNFAVNVALVYLLGQFWTPMWLILVLAPVSTAIYGSRRRTIVASTQASAAILVIHVFRRQNSPLEWGEQFACVLFIFILSLLINESMSAGDPSAAQAVQG